MSLEKIASDGDVRRKGLGSIIVAIVLYLYAPIVLCGFQFFMVRFVEEDLTQGHLVVLFVVGVGLSILATVLLFYGLTKMKQRARADFTTTLKMSRQIDFIYKTMGGN